MVELDSFKKLGLNKSICELTDKHQMFTPTPIQQNCIPEVLKGRDVIGNAHTGSGKTACFALPIIHDLLREPYGIMALVLTPTRELALQIKDQFTAFGKPFHIQATVVTGGMDMRIQTTALANQPHVVIATPGRLVDIITNCPGVCDLSSIKFLVLDEADRLLEPGFAAELAPVFAELPEERQTLLYSATLTDTLASLKENNMTDAFVYSATEGLETVSELEQNYLLMPPTLKETYLHHILAESECESIIVFCGRCATAEKLQVMLHELKIESVALHSMLSMQERMRSLNLFKGLKTKVLIATDVASRGLDIQTVNLVINYDMPQDVKDYIHRVGRTARAGRKGRAISFTTQYDVQRVKAVEADIGTRMTEYELDEKDVIKEISETKKAAFLAEMHLRDTEFAERQEKRKTTAQTSKKLAAQKKKLGKGKVKKVKKASS